MKILIKNVMCEMSLFHVENLERKSLNWMILESKFSSDSSRIYIPL